MDVRILSSDSAQRIEVENAIIIAGNRRTDFTYLPVALIDTMVAIRY
jgi:hypothetical protein|tara:strand:+ start:315 stop:455 length:141 start_codon:yes stop_codon:yes gene_type:complete